MLIIVGDLITGAVSSNAGPHRESGSGTCTIAALSPNCSQTVTFKKAYPTAPVLYGYDYTANIITTTRQDVITMFTQEPVAQPEIFDTSAVTPDLNRVASPMVFTITITPSQPKEFGVLFAYMVNANLATAFTVTSVTDTQTNNWSQQVTFAQANDGLAGGLSVWSARLATTVADTITVTITDSNAAINDWIGGTVELFQNVAGIGNTQATLNHSGLSNQLNTVVQSPADYIIGGSELSVTLSGVCDSIALSSTSGIMTTRQTDTACAANHQINFASGDILTNGAVGSLGFGFKATYGAADGDAIAAMDLLPNYTGGFYWNIPFNSQSTELFNQTDHEVVYAPPSGVGTTTISTHFTCLFSSNPAIFGVPTSPLRIRLFAGTTQVTDDNMVCNGLDQSNGHSFTGGNGNFRMVFVCNSSCPASFMITSLYFVVIYNYNQLPTFTITTTTTTITFTVVLLASVSSPYTPTWNYWAEQ